MDWIEGSSKDANSGFIHLFRPAGYSPILILVYEFSGVAYTIPNPKSQETWIHPSSVLPVSILADTNTHECR